MQINRRQTILVLSRILGFVGIDDSYHGHRVGYIVWRLSQQLRLPEDHAMELMEAGLLHDIGVSSTVAHQMLVSTMDVPDAIKHCLIGERLIDTIPTLSHLAPLVRYHHEHWKHFEAEQAIHPTTALYSNLIFLADRLDVLMAKHPISERSEREVLLERLVQMQDLLFAPQAIEALLAEAEDELFWQSLERKEAIHDQLSQLDTRCRRDTIDFSGLAEIATTFSHVVDAKSPFTHEHSQSMARVAELLGLKVGYSDLESSKLRVAGLFHDIGKLCVPDQILEKPGPLEQQERERIEKHPEDSWRILSLIHGLEDISEWTWMHHEKLNGEGYPRGLQEEEIPHQAQILAVADVYQALLQSRPYRSSMGLQEVYQILDRMAAKREINGELVALVKQFESEFLEMATATDTE